MPLDSKDRARGEREDEDGADRWGPGVSGWARGAGVRCWAGGCLAELGWRGAGLARGWAGNEEKGGGGRPVLGWADAGCQGEAEPGWRVCSG